MVICVTITKRHFIIKTIANQVWVVQFAYVYYENDSHRIVPLAKFKSQIFSATRPHKICISIRWHWDSILRHSVVVKLSGEQSDYINTTKLDGFSIHLYVNALKSIKINLILKWKIHLHFNWNEHLIIFLLIDNSLSVFIFTYVYCTLKNGMGSMFSFIIDYLGYLRAWHPYGANSACWCYVIIVIRPQYCI